MMLREVLLKEDLHHMMSIDDGNFPGDDIIPMSEIFTENEEKLPESSSTRRPGRVRLPGMRFPPDGKKSGTKKTKTRKDPPLRKGMPGFNSLFKRKKAWQAKNKATEESIEKIVDLASVRKSFLLPCPELQYVRN